MAAEARLPPFLLPRRPLPPFDASSAAGILLCLATRAAAGCGGACSNYSVVRGAAGNKRRHQAEEAEE